MGNGAPKEGLSQMQGENFLLAVARIALTFVTFASVVNLWRHGPGPWTDNEKFGLKLLVRFDLAATSFALLPFPLFYSLKSEAAVWRLGGTLLTLFLCYSLLLDARVYRRATKPRHPKLFFWLFIVPMIGAIFLEAQSVWTPSLAVYSWGLLWLMCPPAIQFLIFLSHFGEPLSQQPKISDTPSQTNN